MGAALAARITDSVGGHGAPPPAAGPATGLIIGAAVGVGIGLVVCAPAILAMGAAAGAVGGVAAFAAGLGFGTGAASIGVATAFSALGIAATVTSIGLGGAAAGARLGKDIQGTPASPAPPCTKIVPGAVSTVKVEGMLASVVTDHGGPPCCMAKIPAMLMKGADDIFVEGKAVLRVGDPATCGGMIVTGAKHTYFGAGSGSGSGGKAPAPKEEGLIADAGGWVNVIDRAGEYLGYAAMVAPLVGGVRGMAASALKNRSIARALLKRGISSELVGGIKGQMAQGVKKQGAALLKQTAVTVGIYKAGEPLGKGFAAAGGWVDQQAGFSDGRMERASGFLGNVLMMAGMHGATWATGKVGTAANRLRGPTMDNVQVQNADGSYSPARVSDVPFEAPVPPPAPGAEALPSAANDAVLGDTVGKVRDALVEVQRENAQGNPEFNAEKALSGENLQNLCGVGQELSAEALQRQGIPAESVKPLQAADVFGDSAGRHAFATVEMPDGRTYLVDTTHAQFTAPGDPVGAAFEATPEGRRVSAELTEKGYVELTPETADAYGQAHASQYPKRRAGKRTFTPEDFKNAKRDTLLSEEGGANNRHHLAREGYVGVEAEAAPPKRGSAKRPKPGAVTPADAASGPQAEQGATGELRQGCPTCEGPGAPPPAPSPLEAAQPRGGGALHEAVAAGPQETPFERLPKAKLPHSKWRGSAEYQEATKNLSHETKLALAYAPDVHEQIVDHYIQGKSIEIDPSLPDGSAYCDREGDRIVGTSKGLDAAGVVHELGHDRYEPPPVDLDPATTPPQDYVKANVDGHLLDEAHAVNNNLLAREAILANGGPDIGLCGVDVAPYEQVLAEYRAGNLTEAQYLNGLAELMRNESTYMTDAQGNQSLVTYDVYYGQPYIDQLKSLGIPYP